MMCRGYVKRDYYKYINFFNKELEFVKSEFIPDLWIESSKGDRGYETKDIIFIKNIIIDNIINNL